MISSLYNRAGVKPPLDGVTPIFVEVGADPSVAPGYDAPPGSIAARSGVFYWKVDTGLTDWVTTPFSSGGGGGGGITNVTGTDGVTVTTPVAGVKNATNDLVTGVDVAQLNVDSLGGATIDAVAAIVLTSGTALTLHAIAGHLTLDTDGAFDLLATPARDLLATPARDETHTVGRNFSVTASGSAGINLATDHATAGPVAISSGHSNVTIQALDDGEIQLSSAGASGWTAAGNLSLAATGTSGILLDTKGTGVPAANSIVVNSDEDFTVHADDDIAIAADDGLTLGSGGGMLLDSVGAMTLSTQAAANDITIQAGDDIHLTAADAISVVATNLLTLGGAAGAANFGGPFSLTTTDDVTVTTNDGDFTVDAGAGQLIFDGAGLSFFGGGGNGQKTHINDPTGGTVQDDEARTAIASILDALQGWGLMEA